MLKFPDKTPTDVLIRAFDWTDWLPTGEVITDASVTVTLKDTGQAVGPSDIQTQGLVFAGSTVTFMISNGVAGVTYQIGCTISTSGNEAVTRYATQAVKATI